MPVLNQKFHSSYVTICSKNRNLWRLLSSGPYSHKKNAVVTFILSGWYLFIVVIYTLLDLSFLALFCLKLLNFKMHLTTQSAALVLPLKETHARRASRPSTQLYCLKMIFSTLSQLLVGPHWSSSCVIYPTD